jgi:hypothetical protein
LRAHGAEADAVKGPWREAPEHGRGEVQREI